MSPRRCKIKELFVILFLTFVALISLMQIGCDKKSKPSSPNPEDSLIVLPLVPFSPYPPDKAVDLGVNCTFSWQCDNPDSDEAEYIVYMGTDSLIPIFGCLSSKYFAIPWGRQYRAKEMLIQIYQMQSAYRNQCRSYCLNGTVASRTNRNTFERIGVTIDSTDCYSYCMTAASNTFRCTAVANLDDDATDDVWIIDQTGTLEQTMSDFCDGRPFEFYPATTYSWKVLVLTNHDRDSTWGPIWHFTTTDNIIPPDYDIGIPHLPVPEDYAVGVTCSTVFYWYCVSPPNDSLSYDLYLSLGDSDPQPAALNLPISQTYLDWGKQWIAQQVLRRIYVGEQNFKDYGFERCYILDGISANYGHDYFHMLGVDIDLIDFYNYSISASCDTFTCTATANIDADPVIDTLTIDQTGVIRHLIDDSDMLFTPGQSYSWKVIAHDSHGNQYAGPIWHFTTAE